MIVQLFFLCVQQDGFADDTVRMIKQLRTANPAIQVLRGRLAAIDNISQLPSYLLIRAIASVVLCGVFTAMHWQSGPVLQKRRAALPQILLFSATFNERVKRFATKILPDANQVM
jgi:superfamily II DNA/RNA helicase